MAQSMPNPAHLDQLEASFETAHSCFVDALVDARKLQDEYRGALDRYQRALNELDRAGEAMSTHADTIRSVLTFDHP